MVEDQWSWNSPLVLGSKNGFVASALFCSVWASILIPDIIWTSPGYGLPRLYWMLLDGAGQQETKCRTSSKLIYLIPGCKTDLILTKGTSLVRMTVAEDDIKKRILHISGPFCSAKRVYNSYSPSPKVTEKCMVELAGLSLGTHKKVQRSSYFLKSLPSALTNSQHQLEAFDLKIKWWRITHMSNN